MATRYLDDFSAGERFEAAPVVLTERDIVAFAELYDPQPIHIDPAAAAGDAFGGLIASGFQTIALGFGQFIRLGLFEGVSLGGPAMDEVRWLRPVYPGNTLLTIAEVLSTRPSRSKPDRGVLGLAFEMANQDDEVVCTFKTTSILRRQAEK